ncbi:NAD(P)H-binding protein [Lentzea sp. NPDC059081]|uniref:NAD(P)H-binding protein n=1 Tax=Lentzea sp. NPDC059081 TaxID=3346719 RepID=UPI0036A5F5B6
MSVVVFGATGRLGRHLVRCLLVRGADPGSLHGTGRKAERLRELAGTGVRTSFVDYDDPESVRRVLGRGDTLMLVSGSDMAERAVQHRTVVDTAVAAGVARIVYTSVVNAGDPAFVFAPDHIAAETHVRDSGVPFTFLRNGWYTENFGHLLRFADTTGTITTCTGGGRVASATRLDLADAAAAVLVGGDVHDGRTYELGGDQAWSFDEFAQACAEVLGKPVRHNDVTPDQRTEFLVGQAGLTTTSARFVTDFDLNVRDGLLGRSTGELSRLIGRPTTPLLDSLRVAAGKVLRRAEHAAPTGS